MITRERFYGGARAISMSADLTLPRHPRVLTFSATSLGLKIILPSPETYRLGGPHWLLHNAGTNLVSIRNDVGASLGALDGGYAGKVLRMPIGWSIYSKPVSSGRVFASLGGTSACNREVLAVSTPDGMTSEQVMSDTIETPACPLDPALQVRFSKPLFTINTSHEDWEMDPAYQDAIVPDVAWCNAITHAQTIPQTSFAIGSDVWFTNWDLSSVENQHYFWFAEIDRWTYDAWRSRWLEMFARYDCATGQWDLRARLHTTLYGFIDHWIMDAVGTGANGETVWEPGGDGSTNWLGVVKTNGDVDAI